MVKRYLLGDICSDQEDYNNKSSEMASFFTGGILTFKTSSFTVLSHRTLNSNRPERFPASDPDVEHAHLPEGPPTSTTRTELYTPKDAIPALRPVSSMPSPADDVKQCTSEKLVVSLQTGLANTSARWKGTTNTHGTRTVESLWPNISAKGVTIPSVTCRCL